jgi:hypothetical protein
MHRRAGGELDLKALAARHGDRRAKQYRNKQTTHTAPTTPETRQSTLKIREFPAFRHGMISVQPQVSRPSHASHVSHTSDKHH